ncbi:DUF5060 domain-containing protein [Botrimarina hoheduenensis]|uniref:Uncharacterized protein n=1 Tax=Botrimarina hoheduenensis TaxID=2528000 RepID=A0A5C5VPX4_9BACT|nr:DUF5060 domain-containing protein [Botrimarina hoheduenensis]TWT40656.1 hypothetical protein Pla111_33010 [Botrimarina hoheduenensis]
MQRRKPLRERVATRLGHEPLERRELLNADPVLGPIGSEEASGAQAVEVAAPAGEGGATTAIAPAGAIASATTGELKLWHKVTLDFEGPQTSESATPNPFTDYRLDVTFSHAGSGKTYRVPGYYAADGDAANTSATSGAVWRVHFAPDEIGAWDYSVSFRTGGNVAVSESPLAGASAGFFDGDTGTLVIEDTDKTGRDLRGKGRLEYVGERYLRFAGTGDYFLKQGADSPENLLAYDEFDGPFANDGQGDNFVKSWQPHVGDWRPGDPTWGDDRGKGLIGAVNYLASEGLNAFSFLPMNIAGDDKNVFPYTTYTERLRMDVSRLAQWEVVFEHADHEGMFLHFKTQETENDQLLDGGALGTQRKLYYRELIARFGHHLALNWNLGEENTNTTQQQKDFAQFFRDNDPYNHHVVIHTFPGQQDAVYDPLLGAASELTGASLQTTFTDFRRVHSDTARWVRDSAAAGKPWAVAVDEPGDAQNALRPDSNAGNSHIDGRKNALWGTLMAGGWGNEYYFGYGFNDSDLTLQDFRSRDAWWDYARYALEFFDRNEVPFWNMENDNAISSAANDYGFYDAGGTYVVYLKDGGTTNLDLRGETGLYDVRWYDPRNGGGLQTGSTLRVTGLDWRSLGTPPSDVNQDWVILVRPFDPDAPNTPPGVSITDATPVATSDGVFQEENGLVLFELESQPAAGGWELQSSVPGFTGSGYYRWEGPNLFGNPGAQGVTQYRFNVTNPGTYQMRFHNHRNGGIPFDQENDVWTRMDNGQWVKVFSGTQGQWNWASNFDFGEGNRPSASYNLAAGEHTFTISGRSTGFRIDRVALYNTSLTGSGVALNLNTPTSSTGVATGDLTFDLSAIVEDDGKQSPTPTLSWTLDAGPGTALFSDPDSQSTQVTFSTPGVYRVRLTADDREFETSDVRVIVAPPIEVIPSEASVGPLDDATVEGVNGQNNNVIKAQLSGPARTGYFKFDASGLNAAGATDVRLRLVVAQDAGSGKLDLYTGTSNSWTEETINAANAPATGVLVDSVDGTHPVGKVVEFDVSSVVTGDGPYTFVLKQANGNDVWFSSKEGGSPPLLVASRADISVVGDYDRDGAVDADDGAFWRISYGATAGDGLLADGNGDGVVNAADYTLWRDAFDQNAASVSSPVVEAAAPIVTRAAASGSASAATAAAVASETVERPRYAIPARARFAPAATTTNGPIELAEANHAIDSAHLLLLDDNEALSAVEPAPDTAPMDECGEPSEASVSLGEAFASLGSES